MPEGSLDHRSIARLRKDVGDETLGELIGMYLADAPKMLDDMRGAARDGDARTLERAAHTLKSTSDAMGAKAVASACRELEQFGREGTLEGASEKIAVVATLYEAAQKELRGQLDRVSR